MLAEARHSHEVTLFVELLRLDYEEALESLVTCDETQVMFFRAKAQVYRTLINQFTRGAAAVAQLAESE